MEALEEAMVPKDQTLMVKGKRTKRQRPQSPISFTMITATHSSGGGEEGDYTTTTTASSPPVSAASYSSKEDEETAECLILLAQGRSPGFSPKAAAVYECKTCCKSFASFQALGGHRASHKKLKLKIFSDKFKIRSSISPTRAYNGNFTLKSASKVHECSVCGVQFPSGQALGGHMRRHRGGPAGGATTALSLGFVDDDYDDRLEVTKKTTRDFLGLDLNLPAPETRFALGLKQQEEDRNQPALALSIVPTLVDCHY